MSIKKKEYSDIDLVEGVRSQDNRILLVVYERFYPATEGYILNNSGTIDDAKDTFQETIIVLYRKTKAKDFQLTSTLQSYVFSISRLLWLKELENSKRYLSHKESFGMQQELTQEDELEREILYHSRLKLYREIFETLTKDCKKVLRLFLNGLSLKEITEFMGYSSIQHTKNRRYRCKEFLIKKIKEDIRFNKLSYGQGQTD